MFFVLTYRTSIEIISDYFAEVSEILIEKNCTIENLYFIFFLGLFEMKVYVLKFGNWFKNFLINVTQTKIKF